MVALAALEKLRDALRASAAGSAKVDLPSSTRSMYLLLTDVLFEIRSASEKSAITFTDLSGILDELWASKKINFNANYSSLILAIIREVLHRIPGFVVRTLVTTAINLCNSKTVAAIPRENALGLMAMLIEHRITDCASQSMDVFQTASKLQKASEVANRIQVVSVYHAVIVAGGGKLSDMYVEVMKALQRSVTDKHEAVRELTLRTVKVLAEYSDSFAIVPADALLLLSVKYLEDEIAIVQNAAALAVAAIYELQVRAFVDKQEQAKIGAARGSDTAKAKPAPAVSRMSLAKLTSTRKVVEEQHDFRTVVDIIIRQIHRTQGTLRAGYILVLGYLVQGYLDGIDADDLEWISLALITIAQDTGIQQLPFFDQANLKTRLSMVFRSYLVAKLPEQQLIAVAATLIKASGGLEAGNHSDLEMQMLLEEINHVLNVLGLALISLRDEATTCATINLRHSSFAVRVAAANVLVTVSAAVPAVAVDFVRNAMNNTKTQASQLAAMDASNDDFSMDEDANVPSPKRKSSKEVERLQRMYFFHGHAIVIAMILRNANRIPHGLSCEDLMQAFDFGLSLMSNDLYAGPTSSKHILCSIIRAGALIVSSCLSLGYEVSRFRIRQILDCCTKLFRLGELDPQVASSKPEDLIYEVMCIESAVVCTYTLLQYSSEALALEDMCLVTVIDNLEMCFRNVKNKYQPTFRNHFRFRTLHVILLESFALLPPGAYPHTCQQIYVEALRVFRDCITNGLECTSPILEQRLRVNNPPDMYEFLVLASDQIVDEALVLLKLEQHTTTLQKKESEAFLTLFGQDFMPMFAEHNHLFDSRVHVPDNDTDFKSSLIDTRSIDTAVNLMAITFPHQSSEYQDKAIQLFAQAIAQVAAPPPSRMSITASSKLFSSAAAEEERKRKERKAFLVHKNIVCSLFAIVDAFPVHSGEVVELDYQWRETLIEQLYTFLPNKSDLIRAVASVSLTTFADKWRGYNVIASVSHKIRGAIIPALEKRTGDATMYMDEFSGFIIALGHLWTAAGSQPDVRSLISTVS